MDKRKLKKHMIDTAYVRYRKKNIIKNAVLLEAAKGQGIDGHIIALLKADKIKQFTKIYVAVVPRKMAQVTNILKMNDITGVELVEYNSVDYFKKLARCEYLINDTTFGPIFSKRPEQKYSIIWHGTPQKRLGNDIRLTGFGNVQNNFLAADSVIVSNEHTKDVMINAFNLNGISSTNMLVAPSPRNSLLFMDGKKVYGEYITTDKNYLYLPTWRDGGQETYLKYLQEIDELLTEDETFFVKLHPMAKKLGGLNFSDFEHIKEFPEADLYQFITMMDIVVTDYSSIFFDLFNLNKKIVLFNYDKEEYFKTRGVYDEVRDLGLEECATVEELVSSLHGNPMEDYSRLAEVFTKYDSAEGSNQLLDYIVTGNTGDTIDIYNPRNEKENVVIFAGALWDNGISKSFFNFINDFETDKTNIILMIERAKIARKHMHKLENLPEHVTYIERHGGPVATAFEKVTNKYYKNSKEPRKFDRYMLKFVKKVFKREFDRVFGNLDVSQFIHFTGFDANIALLLVGGGEQEAEIRQTIFCHTDMVEEYEKKKNYNRKMLLEAYKTVDTIAVVNQMIGETLVEKYPYLEGKVKTATNFLGNKQVSEMANAPLFLGMRYKKITIGLPISEKITQIITDNEIEKKFVRDIIGNQVEEFPNLIKVLPKINEENSAVLPEGYAVNYGLEMLPHIYGYTKMRALEDLENPNIKVFVYLGRYSPEKGLERLLYSFEKLYETNNDIRLLMISPHGATKKKVLNYIRKSSIREAIYIFDGMDNPYNLVKKCDALVLSSYYEGLGLVALEAIASGTKVIATDLPELTRIVLAHSDVTSTVRQDETLEYDEEEYERFITDNNLVSKGFEDEHKDIYPVLYDGDVMVVENSARGIYYGMSHYLKEDVDYHAEFRFEELKLISQKQYNQFLK